MSKILKKDIPDGAKNIVVFVHGFGVRWDSRGMFTDIKGALPEEFGTVLFDLYDASDDDVYVTPISDQVNRLDQIISDVSTQYSSAKLHIIAHSKGCVVTALSSPVVSGRIILLSPPETFGSRLQKYFEKQPGTIRVGDSIAVPRKDGTTTHIPLQYFEDSQGVDPQAEINKLSREHEIIIVQTTQDEVIRETFYEQLKDNKNIKIIQVASDHNFTDRNREQLIGIVKELLK